MSVLDHDYEDLRVELDGQVAVLTFDRPDALNAFSGAMGRSLTTALRAADSDEAVRVVVITGAGRAFCAGADFSGGSGVFGAPTKETFSSDPLDDFHPWDVRKPVIAAINGHAVGLGLTMTLQCDIRVVAEEAKLGIVQNRRGILPDAHSHWTLPRLVGHTRATEILLTGRMFRGTDAGEWGLATEVLRRALPQDPPHCVDNIGFAAAVWSHDRAHVAWKVDRSRVNEGFEPSQLYGFETHLPTY